MKNFIISELEKKTILKKYGILNEQNKPVSTNVITQAPQNGGVEVMRVDKNVTFPAGYYNETYLEQSDITLEIKKVIDFLEKSKSLKNTSTYLVNLNIQSGESQIPNTDKENNGDRVDPGFLARQRSNTIVTYVKRLIAPYVGNVLPKNVEPTVSTPEIGKTKWIGQPFCPQKKIPADDAQGYVCTGSNFKPAPNIQNWYYGKNKEYKTIFEEYKKEQYIRVILTVNQIKTTPPPTETNPGGEDKPCLFNMQLWLNYEGQGHTCNSAVYELKLIGDKGGEIILTRASKSKSGAIDDGKSQYASLNNNGNESRALFKSGENVELKSYDNEDPDSKSYNNGGHRYNMFLIPNDVKTTLKNSTVFTLMGRCINPTNHKAKEQWKWNCHTAVGLIKIIPGNGQESIYGVQTPSDTKEVAELLRFDECGNVIQGNSMVRVIKQGGKNAKSGTKVSALPKQGIIQKLFKK